MSTRAATNVSVGLGLMAGGCSLQDRECQGSPGSRDTLETSSVP